MQDICTVERTNKERIRGHHEEELGAVIVVVKYRLCVLGDCNFAEKRRRTSVGYEIIAVRPIF